MWQRDCLFSHSEGCADGGDLQSLAEPGGELHINQEEISEVRRVAPSELDGYLRGRPEQLAPWLREALEVPSIRAALAM